jgi:hypothetical protein
LFSDGNRTIAYRDKKVVGVFVLFRAPLHLGLFSIEWLPVLSIYHHFSDRV